jgi:hypothetical protein
MTYSFLPFLPYIIMFLPRCKNVSGRIHQHCQYELAFNAPPGGSDGDDGWDDFEAPRSEDSTWDGFNSSSSCDGSSIDSRQGIPSNTQHLSRQFDCVEIPRYVFTQTTVSSRLEFDQELVRSHRTAPTVSQTLFTSIVLISELFEMVRDPYFVHLTLTQPPRFPSRSLSLK